MVALEIVKTFAAQKKQVEELYCHSKFKAALTARLTKEGTGFPSIVYDKPEHHLVMSIGFDGACIPMPYAHQFGKREDIIRIAINLGWNNPEEQRRDDECLDCHRSTLEFFDIPASLLDDFTKSGFDEWCEQRIEYTSARRRIDAVKAIAEIYKEFPDLKVTRC